MSADDRSLLLPIEATGDPEAERYAAEMRARAFFGFPVAGRDDVTDPDTFARAFFGLPTGASPTAADATGENNNDKETTDE